MSNPDITIDLKVNDRKFRDAMSKIGSTLKTVSDKVRSFSDKAKWAFAGLTAAIGGFVAAAMMSQSTVKRLDATIRAIGESTAIWSEKLQEAAKQMQLMTRYSDNAILSAMQLGLSYGIAIEKIEAATRAAIGLSATYGIDLREAIKKVAEVLSGNDAALEELVQKLRGVTDEAERARIVSEAFASSWEVAKEGITDAAGKLTLLKNAILDLAEAVGDAMIDDVASAIDVLSNLTRWVSDLVSRFPAAVKYILLIGTAIAALLAVLSPVLGAMAAMVTMASLIAGPVGVAAIAIGGLIVVVNALGAALIASLIPGETIKQKIDFVITLFKGYLLPKIVTSVAFMITAFENFGLYIKSIFGMITATIIEKVGAATSWVMDKMSYLISFLDEDLSKKIKGIAKDIEATYKSTAKGLRAPLREFGRELDKNRKRVNGWIDGLFGDGKGGNNENETPTPEVTPTPEPTPEQGPEKTPVSSPSIMFESIESAFSRIANAAAGRKDPNVQVAENTAKMLEVNDGMLDVLTRLEKTTGKMESLQRSQAEQPKNPRSALAR